MTSLADYDRQQGGTRNALAPFYMDRPPVMSPAEIALYRGAAYGTPHEAYIDNPANAAAFRNSLGSPITAYGLDFGRVQSLPQSQQGWADRMMGAPVHGFYLPQDDVGYAVEYPTKSPGSSLTHEMQHRGFHRMRRDLEARGQHSPVTGAPMPTDSQELGARNRRIDAFWAALGDQHGMMAEEERRLGSAGSTRLVPDSAIRPSMLGDSHGSRLDKVYEAIEWLRRERGDFSRMGPR